MSAYDLAVRLLARRAHGERELAAKLRRRQFGPDAIERVLDRCRALNYLDDLRFAKDRLRSRLTNHGWGPIRAKSELNAIGICPDYVTLAFESVLAEIDLFELASQVLHKRFGHSRVPLELKEKKRRQDFLFRRGFDGETIRSVFG
ncbi:MAG: regulatory protein RecX [Magnetococcales bacterium]|nr:regulatory protein RecX [Magnetococcales bacterium]